MEKFLKVSSMEEILKEFLRISAGLSGETPDFSKNKNAYPNSSTILGKFLRKRLETIRERVFEAIPGQGFSYFQGSP